MHRSKKALRVADFNLVVATVIMIIGLVLAMTGNRSMALWTVGTALALAVIASGALHLDKLNEVKYLTFLAERITRR